MKSYLRRTLHFLAFTGFAAIAAAPAATMAAEPGGTLLAQAPGDSKEKSKPKSLTGSKAKTPPKPAAPKPAAGKAAGEAPPAPTEEAGPTLVQRAVSFIKTYPLWIGGGLGAILLVLLGWALLSARARPAGEDPFTELGFGEGSADPAVQRRFSSTKIQAADVKSRLAGAVKTTEVETDREYALVVDEEALKMPPLPEEAEEASRAGSASLEKLLTENDAEGAYAEYARRVQSDPKAEFDPALERSLSEHLIRSRKLAEAARVLEHHLRTHGAEEIHPDCYFNLGYIHFMQKTLKKSSRFLKLFVKVEKNPAHVERAMRILRRIESSGGVG